MSDCAKITEAHRRRRAVVYVRQSIAAVRLSATMSHAALQYALRDRAIELGWLAESVVGRRRGPRLVRVPRRDGRLGFKELVAEVGLGHVGLILGLEISRLARTTADWHQLLDLCALTGTLIADADGLYGPATSTTGCSLGLSVTDFRPSLTSSTSA